MMPLEQLLHASPRVWLSKSSKDSHCPGSRMWARSWPCTWWLRGPWRSIGRAYPRKRLQVGSTHKQAGKPWHIYVISVPSDVPPCGTLHFCGACQLVLARLRNSLSPPHLCNDSRP